jgi:hypothetical protein
MDNPDCTGGRGKVTFGTNRPRAVASRRVARLAKRPSAAAIEQTGEPAAKFDIGVTERRAALSKRHTHSPRARLNFRPLTASVNRNRIREADILGYETRQRPAW